MGQIIKVSSGGRGRPLELDVDKALKQFMTQLPQAKARLSEIRRTTSGERSEAILGSETTLPKSFKASADVLDALMLGQKIDYATAKELKENLRSVEQLASRQERVYGRALAKTLQKQYESELDYQSKYASPQVKKIYQQMKQNTQKLTQQQQQAFYTSKGYQSVKSFNQRYKKLKEWAEADYKKRTGQYKSMTYQEAEAYVLMRRQEDELRSKGLL